MERSVTRETIAGVAGAGILGVIVFLVSFAPAGFRLWGMDGLAYDPRLSYYFSRRITGAVARFCQDHRKAWQWK